MVRGVLGGMSCRAVTLMRSAIGSSWRWVEGNGGGWGGVAGWEDGGMGRGGEEMVNVIGMMGDLISCQD